MMITEQRKAAVQQRYGKAIRGKLIICALRIVADAAAGWIDAL